MSHTAHVEVFGKYIDVNKVRSISMAVKYKLPYQDFEFALPNPYPIIATVVPYMPSTKM